MKKLNTQYTLNEFFEEFKNLPYSYNIEQVHHLLNNPNAKATHKVSSYFKHLKITIMTSAFIIGVSTLLVWFSTNRSEIKGITTEKKRVHVGYANHNEDDTDQISTIQSEYIVEKHDVEKLKSVENDIKLKTSGEEKPKHTLPGVKDKINDSLAEKECNWPSDTIIDKNSLVIQLSDKEEFSKLGVVLKKDTLIIIQDTILKRGGYRYSSHNNLKGLKLSENDIIPEFLTIEINLLHISMARVTGLYDACDTLLPVVLGNSGHVLWYNGTPEFFNRLPERFKHLEVVTNNLKQLKAKNPDRCLVNYFPSISLYNSNTIAPLKLTKDFFRNMGIIIEDTIFSMQYPEHGISFSMIKNKTNIYMSPELYKKFPDLNPVFITDKFGNIDHNLYRGDSSLNYDVIVPVLVDFEELIGLQGPDYWTKKIFWYYPNDNFIVALPVEVCEDLKLERDNILNNDNTAPKTCTYFEVCKSTLQLDNFKLYPNPARNSVTIEFDILDETVGFISIINIAGAKIKTLVSNSIFSLGFNTYEMDISGIPPGIYLLSVNTDQGFKTQRLIISK